MPRVTGIVSLKPIVHSFGRWYMNRICTSESSGQSYSHHNERSIEYRFALESLGEYRPKTVLDVGTGTTAWPHLLHNCGYVVTAIDNVRDYWPSGMVNRHWKVMDVDITKPVSMPELFDAVTCISVLEHIEDYDQAVAHMVELIPPGGQLVLSCPYNHSTFYPNVYQHPEALYGKDNPYVCRSYSWSQMEGWLNMGLTLVKKELWRLFDGPLWATGNRTAWERVASDRELHQLGCFLLRKR